MTKALIERMKSKLTTDEFAIWKLRRDEARRKYRRDYMKRDHVKAWTKKYKTKIKDRIRPKINAWARASYHIHIFRSMVKQANKSVKRLNEPIKLKPFDLWKLAKRQKCKCALTGLPLTKDNISLDHIQAVSLGGNNSSENLRFVTKRVNIAKQNMTDREFFQLCQSVIDYQPQRGVPLPSHLIQNH
jgi:5-methylcytosine-specific restriction endonuclease McrA